MPNENSNNASTASEVPVAFRQRFWLVFLLFLHTVNTYMDRVCISAAKDDIQRDISGLDDQMMGYVFGIFAIGYALFQIPAGWFSDRAGPRHALTIVVIIWSIFTALTGAVYTAISLIVVRFLFGAGEAGAYPGATRALYSWLPAKERGLGQGIFHSGADWGGRFFGGDAMVDRHDRLANDVCCQRCRGTGVGRRLVVLVSQRTS